MIFIILIFLLCIKLATTKISKDEMPLIDLNQKNSLRIISDNYLKFNVKIYKIASFSNKNRFILTNEFNKYHLNCNKLNDAMDYANLSKTLDWYIKRDNIEPIVSKTITQDNNEIVNLESGLYFLVSENIEKYDSQYRIVPVLISLPTKNFNKEWEYDLDIFSKFEKILAIQY